MNEIGLRSTGSVVFAYRSSPPRISADLNLQLILEIRLTEHDGIINDQGKVNERSGTKLRQMPFDSEIKASLRLLK